MEKRRNGGGGWCKIVFTLSERVRGWCWLAQCVKRNSGCFCLPLLTPPVGRSPSAEEEQQTDLGLRSAPEAPRCQETAPERRSFVQHLYHTDKIINNPRMLICHSVLMKWRPTTPRDLGQQAGPPRCAQRGG